jgi:hypothetical protein
MEKVLLFMQSGAGYITANGVYFSKEHPYQLVETSEASILLEMSRFREAGADELKSYYNYNIAI